MPCLNPFAAENLREMAQAIEKEGQWHPYEFLAKHNLLATSIQQQFMALCGLSTLELKELFPDYDPCAFLHGSEDFGILFRLFFAEAIESGDIV